MASYKKIKKIRQEYSAVPPEAIESSQQLHQGVNLQIIEELFNRSSKGDLYSEDRISDVFPNEIVEQGVVDSDVMPG